MSIQTSELVWRKSSVISDTGTNGGRMSANVSVSNVKNNIWPDIFESERLAGSTAYRKMFILVNNGEANGNNVGLGLIAPRVFVETRSPGDDAVNIFPGTQRDVQAGITGSEQLYGMGILTNSVSSSATSVTVTVEDWSNLPIFTAGMLIRISDKASVSGAGNEEYHTISGAPSAVGNEVTLNLVGSLANGYTAGSGTKISSVYEPGDTECEVTGFANGGSGTFSAAGVTTDARGTVEQDWTITFTTATTYNVVGDEIGSVGSGNVGSDFSPTNPDTGAPYFTLLSSEFGGTFTISDTIDFTTSPAAISLWYRRDVPAGASSLSGNTPIVAVDGESA